LSRAVARPRGTGLGQAVGHVVGIDFGTTHSSVAAVVDRGPPLLIPTAGGGSSMPSVVAFSDAAPGGVWVGEEARRQASANPENTIHGVKRLIGRKFDDPEVTRHRLDAAYGIVAGPGGEAWIRARRKTWAPAEIAAMILRALKKAAEDQLGAPVTDVVMGVPAYFDDAQRQATREAARLAGLRVLRLLNEPTAAVLGDRVLAPAADGRGEENVAVYDLGGGTFDIALLRVRNGDLEVCATGGDGFLGGDDFDQRIVTEIADHLQQEHGMDARTSPAARQQMREAAQAAKHALSGVESAEIGIPFLLGSGGKRSAKAGAGSPRQFVMTLTRDRLEALTKDLVHRTIFACEQALTDAVWQASDVERVLLIGGQTRAPYVRSQVAELLGGAAVQAATPEGVVATGAACLGASLRGLLPDRKLVERSSVSVGVETAGGVFARIIPRQTPLPATRAQIFSTVTDNQQQLTIHVLQGERELAADNKSLGHFRIGDIPPAPRGVPQIELDLQIDENGLVGVSAINLDTGQEQAVEAAAPAPQGG
jgi:molecular chaperone DnaK